MYDLSYDDRNGSKVADMLITRRHDHKVVRLMLGSRFWRMAHFIGHRENSECCDSTTTEIPWDVQQDILGICFVATEKDSKKTTKAQLVSALI